MTTNEIIKLHVKASGPATILGIAHYLVEQDNSVKDLVAGIKAATIGVGEMLKTGDIEVYSMFTYENNDDVSFV